MTSCFHCFPYSEKVDVVLLIIAKGKGNISFHNKAFCHVAVSAVENKGGYNQTEGVPLTRVLP